MKCLAFQPFSRLRKRPMLSMKSLLAAAVALLATPLVAPAPAQAQSWPTRSVRFIVPFGPGAGADIGARLLAEKLQAKWGQPVVVENKPGGDNIIAIQALIG